MEREKECKERIAVIAEAIRKVTGKDIMADSVTRNVPYPELRGMACLALCEAGFTHSEIGQAVRKDHSTVAHLLTKIRGMVYSGVPCFRDDTMLYNNIKKELGYAVD